jgi:exopolysaccharide biosynthesis polyprenyl glycosylphosphotransferase
MRENSQTAVPRGDRTVGTAKPAGRARTVIALPDTAAAAAEVARRSAALSVPRGRATRRWRRLPYLLAVVDCAVLALALALAGTGVWAASAQVVVTLVLLAQADLYRRRLVMSAVDDAPALATRALAGAACVMAAEVALGQTAPRSCLVAAGLVVVIGFALRAAAYAIVRTVRRRGSVGHPTLFLGGGTVSARLSRVLLEHPEYGLRPVGFLDDDPLLQADERPIPHLGSMDLVLEVIEEHGIDDVVVTYGSTPERDIVDILRRCDRSPCEIFLVPRLYEMHALGDAAEFVWGVPLLRLRRAAFRSSAWQAKRVFDVVASGLALAVLSPLLVLIPLAVKWELRGPVLFRQERVGLDGRLFTLLKFRSLSPASPGESAVTWNVGADSRLGRVGRFLRRTSLDELPQLFNILRGDMSIVGPRPERPFFVAEFSASDPRYGARHRVPAGLTGLAQVNGLRGDTSICERAVFDNCYIESWSLWQDVKIILRTCGQIVRAAGR